VAALGLDDAGELGAERGGGLPGVRGSGPVPVAGAGVAVVRQEPGDRPAVVAGVAARAERLGLVPPGGPVRPGVAQLGQRPREVRGRPAGDRGEPAGDDVAAAGSRPRGADLVELLSSTERRSSTHASSWPITRTGCLANPCDRPSTRTCGRNDGFCPSSWRAAFQMGCGHLDDEVTLGPPVERGIERPGG